MELTRTLDSGVIVVIFPDVAIATPARRFSSSVPATMLDVVEKGISNQKRVVVA
jgi:hypothetical protein